MLTSSTRLSKPRRSARALLSSFAALLVLSVASASPAAAQPREGRAPAKPAEASPERAPSPGAARASTLLTLADIRRVGDAFADVAQKVSPSVVQIEVTVENASSPLRWFRGDAIQRGMGSGVIFTSDGAIITNNHVIDDARSISVRLHDGRVLPGRVLGRDPATDLAVLRVDATGLPAATFADSDAARVGEWVLAIGSPFGLGYTVTTGVLSAKGRGGVGVNAVEDYLQTDASINPGNSGGPLVNLDGQVLGINTMIVSRGQGIGLAVPARMARRVAEQIVKYGRVDRARLGVGIQDLTPQLAAEIQGAPPYGALVNSVASTGPAAQANLHVGDIIVSIAGKPVTDAQDVIREVLTHDVGEVVTLEVVRAARRYQTKVRLESRNEPPPPPLPVQRQASNQSGLGLAVRDVADPRGEARGSVAQVTGVIPDSLAERAGIRPGDLILEADGVQQPTAAQIQAAAQDGRMLLRIKRQGATFYTAVRR